MAPRRPSLVPVIVVGFVLAEPVHGDGSELAKNAWRLDVRFDDPRRMTVRAPGDERETSYWYLIFDVTNNTGRDIDFYPSFRLVTNTLQVVEGGDSVNPAVYGSIAARHKAEFPFLSPPAKVTGRLLQGRENSRAVMVVFPTFDEQASSFTVYASGFSGDVRRVANPGFEVSGVTVDADARWFLLRETLAITYDLPGDPTTRGQAAPIRRTRDWVMQ